MAFTTTIENEQILNGNMKIVYGTWDSDSVTGGDIVTGLDRVDIVRSIGHTGSSVSETNQLLTKHYRYFF